MGQPSTTIKAIEDDLLAPVQDKGSSLTFSQVWEKLGVDTIVGILEIFKTVAGVFLLLVDTTAQEAIGFAHQQIDVAVLSKLYEDYISGGTVLSLLDALALVLAIHATISHKIVTENLLTNLNSIDFGSLLDGQILDGDSGLASNSDLFCEHGHRDGQLREIVRPWGDPRVGSGSGCGSSNPGQAFMRSALQRPHHRRRRWDSDGERHGLPS